MKIGFDFIGVIGRGGNSTYSKNLIENIISIDQKNQYYLYMYVHDFLLGRFRFKKIKNLHYRPVYFSSLNLPIHKSIIAYLSKMSVKFWSKVDVLDTFHFTNPLNFVKGLKKSIVTIHDLSSLHNKEWSKISSGEAFANIINDIVTYSDKIIAVSEFTKNDIIENFGTNPDKIKVIYEAADPKIYYPDLDAAFLKSEFNLNSYFLYVGQLQPRKNIINVIKAYAGLENKYKELYPIVLVGIMRDDIYAKEIKETVDLYNLNKFVRILGSQSNDTIRKLYSGAKIFISPSLFEGFGLPLLESIQCGVPVISSKSTSLPEIVGKAGVLIDPENVNQITEAINNLINNKEYYRQLKSECLNQAKKFSWAEAALESIALY